MRFGVISDTHGDFNAIREVVKAVGTVDGWFHTGDYSQDTQYLATLTNVPIYSVCGNCDIYEGRSPQEAIVKLDGFTVALTHGHKYIYGNSLSALAAWGRTKAADVVLFGHTHVALIQETDGLLLFNPGSASRPRKGLPSYGELFLEAGEKPVANINYLD